MKLSAYARKRIDEIIDERANGNGYFVYTKPGYAFFAHPDHRCAEHCHAFDTLKEVEQAMRDVEDCDCARCHNYDNEER